MVVFRTNLRIRPELVSQPMLKALLEKVVSLRRRNQLRLLAGLHPAGLRSRYPDLALMRLPAGAVVFDVGAHIGEFSECVLAHQPWAIIHAFEPQPEVFAQLRRRLAYFGGIVPAVCSGQRPR